MFLTDVDIMRAKSDQNGGAEVGGFSREIDLWLSLALALLFVVALALSVVLHNYMSKADDAARDLDARKTLAAFSRLLKWQFSHIEHAQSMLVDHFDLSSVDSELKHHLDNAWGLVRHNFVTGMFVVSPSGKVLYANPEGVQRDAVRELCLKRHLSGGEYSPDRIQAGLPSKLGSGEEVVPVEMPDFERGKYVGSLVFLINLDIMMADLAWCSDVPQCGSLYVFTPNGKIIYESCKNGDRIDPESPAVTAFMKEVSKRGNGSIPGFVSNGHSGSPLVQFTTVQIEDGSAWVVCVEPAYSSNPPWPEFLVSPPVVIPAGLLLFFVLVFGLLRRRIQTRQMAVLKRDLERRRELLDAANARLSMILESMPYIILETDLDGKIMFLKAAPRGVLGYNVPQCDGKRLLDFATDEGKEKLRKVFDDLLRKGLSANALRVDMAFDLGLPRSYSLNAIPVTNDAGEVIRINGIIHDITERVLFEESLEQSQKMDAIGAVASGVAHDFNNYLTAILGHIGLMKIKGSGGEELAHIEEAAKRAGQLTEQLLAFSRAPRDTDLTVSNLAECVPKTVEMVRNTFPRRLKLELDIPKSPMMVAMAESKIDQVLMNLLVNARDAVDGQGKITVKLWRTELDPEMASRMDLLPGRYVVMEVSDTGPGFPEDVKRRMFEPYFTTKRTGTGLGLASSYMITKNSGGIIVPKSRLGKGASFYVYIPEAATSGEAEEGSPLWTPIRMPTLFSAGKENKALVVEDDELIAKMMLKLFRDMGWKPILAASGEEGVAIFKRRGEEVAIIVSDIMMENMDGVEMLEKIRDLQWGKDVPALFVSGRPPSDAVLMRIRSLGAKFLRKPFNVDELVKVVREILGGEK